jgi:hypothetical protein
MPAEPAPAVAAPIVSQKPENIPVASRRESPPVPPVEAREGMVLARKWPLFASFALLSVAMLVTVILVSRGRKANAGSLITQSYDQRPE